MLNAVKYDVLTSSPDFLNSFNLRTPSTLPYNKTVVMAIPFKINIIGY